QQTDFGNDEAVGYLADRLERLGVEDALFKAGAKPGDAIVVGGDDGVVFDWDPTTVGGAELLGSRGTDARLEEEARATRRERKAAYHERMDAKAAVRAEFEQERLAERARRESPSVREQASDPAAGPEAERPPQLIRTRRPCPCAKTTPPPVASASRPAPPRRHAVSA